MEVARSRARPALQPFLLRPLEGWAQTKGQASRLREVPFPGVPLILNLGEPWGISGESERTEQRDSFLAGLHTRPTVVAGGPSWACIELRLTPLGTYRLLGRPMHELANRTVSLEELVPGAGELTGRLRDAGSWHERFELVEAFLVRRLADSAPPAPGVHWSWEHLRRTGGRVPIADLASDLGWSHRRLIARFREQVGLAPKTLARVIRFDRAVTGLRTRRDVGLAEIAFDCGYFDQAHMNRDFAQFAGTTPAELLAATTAAGGVAA